MQVITNPEMVQSYLAKALGKWVLYIGSVYHSKYGYLSYEWNWEEARACLGSLANHISLVTEGATIICDNEAECDKLFHEVIGDDGPRPGLGYKTNLYNGPYRAYACTFGPDGQSYNENT